MHESFEDKLSAADELIDRAASQIRESAPDAETTSAAAERAWQKIAEQPSGRLAMRLVQDGDATSEDVAGVDDPGLEDSGTAIPAFTARRSAGSRRFALWALAAVLVMAVGVGALLLGELWPAGPSATVQTVDGQLFRVASASQVPLDEGAEILEHEAVRTGREGGAVVRLTDGSLVELAPRSEVSIDNGMGGTTIRLERGNVIVEAAKQRDGHLYVATDDCLVSVTGTIFSVNHGTKGSRVSVIEGEVRVDHGGEETVLHPGGQVTTHALLAPLSVADEIAWSRDVDEYLRILGEFTALERALAEQVPAPGLRYSSRLLDLVPEDTVFFAALPNFTEAMTETHRVLREQIEGSPALSEWWADEAAGQFQEEIDEAVAIFAELGGYLGEEMAVAAHLSGDPAEGDDAVGAVLLAELVDADGLRDFIERHRGDGGEAFHDGDLVVVDDPADAVGGDFYLWLTDGLAVGSDSPERLSRVAEHLDGTPNPFVDQPFHAAIADLYREGAEIVVAADLARVVETRAASVETDDEMPNFEALGVDNVRYLMLEQKRLGDKTHHRAAVSFDDARHGLASWLAEPAPMAGLEFVSPDASLVAAVVFRDPAELLDDVFAVAGGVPEELREAEERFGLSLRDDIAGALGGELVVALDGPLLPSPAWKVVLEVYDPARFQWALEQSLVAINRQLAEEGQEPVEIAETEVGGRTVYTLPAKLVDIHYTFVEGYLLMAPQRALLDQAIRYRDSGYSIAHSAELASLLPQDGRNNVSALVYQDLASMASSVAERLARGQALTDEQRATLEAFETQSGPTLGYAYGERDRITFAASSDGDAIRTLLLRVLGLKNPAGFESLFRNFLGDEVS